MQDLANYSFDNTKIFQRSAVFCFNASDAIKKEITPDGFLVQYDVPIARTGDFIYKAYEFAFISNDGVDPNQDFKVFRDHSSFTQDILDKNKDIPFTNDHPNGPVNTKNANRTIVGGVHDLYVDGDTLYAARIVIHDQKTIDDIEKKGKKEVSIGFEATYDLQPENINGSYYDGREKVLRINHLSLVNAGKAGPQFKMHTKQESKEMSQPETVKVTINGVELDVPADKAIALNQAESNDKYQSLNDTVNTLSEKFNELITSLNEKSEEKSPSKEDKKEDQDDDKKSDDKSDEKKDDSENKCDSKNAAEEVQPEAVEAVEPVEQVKNSVPASEASLAEKGTGFSCNASSVLSESNILNQDCHAVFAAVRNSF